MHTACTGRVHRYIEGMIFHDHRKWTEFTELLFRNGNGQLFFLGNT